MTEFWNHIRRKNYERDNNVIARDIIHAHFNGLVHFRAELQVPGGRGVIRIPFLRHVDQVRCAVYACQEVWLKRGSLSMLPSGMQL